MPKKPKARRKLPEDELTRDVTLEEFANATFEKFKRDPRFARAVRDLSVSQDTPVEVLMYEALGLAYHLQGKPVPPEVREYLIKHDLNMPENLRALLLKPGLN